MERSGFFDANVVDGSYDRAYNAKSFADYFASFIGNGIFVKSSSELQVVESSPQAMQIMVRKGQGWINGYWYENSDNLRLSIDIADGVLPRVDSIVLRKGVLERDIWVEVRKGVPAISPSAPLLVRNEDYYDLKLAEVNIAAGESKIRQENIVDKRLDSTVCGVVKGLVEELDTTYFSSELQSYIANVKITSRQEIQDLVNELNNIISDDDGFGQVVDRLVRLERVTTVALPTSGWVGTTAPYTQTVNVPRAKSDIDAICVNAMSNNATVDEQKAYNKAFNIVSAGTAQMGDGTATFKVYKKPLTDITIGLKGV